ncbi:MAG: alpha/beta fold hydrolase [Gemmatimonadetes bacterium]|nr:MAG: alpha/beta fold hydrolase [Gemmatimonadota bacterium]
MLDYELRAPETPVAGAPLLVLLHGRGTDKRDLLPLARELPQGWTLVTPNAPHPGAHWGYGAGWAWYRYQREDQVVSDTLRLSLDRLDRFLEAVPSLLDAPPGPLVLGGFSQGGTTSLAYALTRPGRVRLVANLSGFLARDEAVPVTREAVAGTRIFWGHGLNDPAIPHALARRGRDALRAVGADLTVRDYDAGHWIAPEEMRDLVRWVEQAGSA